MKYEEEEEDVPNAWSSELPADIVGLISDRLISLSLPEFVRFGAVCVAWRSFSIDNYQPIKLPGNLPVLLIPLPSLSTTITDYPQIPSPPPPPLPSSFEEEEEKGSMEEKVEEDYGEEEVGTVDDEDEEEDEEEEEGGRVEREDEEGRVGEKEYNEEDEDDYEEDEDYYVIEKTVWKEEDYYNPRHIWQGQDNKQRYKSTRNFYSIYENKVYHDFPLPVPTYKNVRGSSNGWLVTVEECCSDDGVDYYPVRLFNPFRTDNNNNNEIQLPPLSCLLPKEESPVSTSCYLKKAFLSANPSSLSDPTTQLVVLGINFHNRLSFCRPGDKAWTYMDTTHVYMAPVNDIICYQGQFYAVLQNGIVFAFILFESDDQLHPSPVITVKLLPPDDEEDSYPPKGYVMRYIVESRGELFQIRRDVASCSGYYRTSQFLVFKLDPKENHAAKWVETKTLNDSMFFLGSSSTSMSLSASDYPGCKPNSIYYTDDMELYWMSTSMVPYDIGVFNVEDGSFERNDALELRNMPPPIWIQPMLY